MYSHLIKKYAEEHGIKNYKLEHGIWQAHNFAAPLDLGKGVAFFYHAMLQTKSNTYFPYLTNLRLANKNGSFDLPFMFENNDEIWRARFVSIMTDTVEIQNSTGTLTIHPTPAPAYVAGDLHIYTSYFNYYLLTPKETE